MILVRVGAPKWLSMIVVSWGVSATLFAAMKTRTEFYVLRFLLGVTECGTFPGGHLPPSTGSLVGSVACLPTGPTAGRLTLHVPHAGMWYHMSLFYSEKELAMAYSWISAGTALSQVVMSSDIFQGGYASWGGATCLHNLI